MPKYSVNNIPDGFKAHIKNIFALLNLIENKKNCGLKLEILLGKYEKRQCQMTEEALKIVRDRQEAKAKGDKSSVRILNAVFQ